MMPTDQQYRTAGEGQFSQDAMDAITDKVLAFKPRKKASPPTGDKSAGGQSPHQSGYPAES